MLYGRVADAERTFARFERLWARHRALPDLYDVQSDTLLSYGRDYPLRPEMIESAYHLYAATRHSHYLDFAQSFLGTLRAARTPCGYASIADVTTGRLDDRMDSFFLSETLKVPTH